MWQFIILGYVPGTSIQINFYSVALIAALITVLFLTKSLIKEHLRLIKSNTLPNFDEITI